jgi:phosphoenolpyruvate carboxykinase (GTP)
MELVIFSLLFKHDPFAMRPFFGYNFGDYVKHWLSLNQPGRTMPKIFHVNWFRKSNDGQGSFLWPGFGENIRVLEWIFKRTDNEAGISHDSPIGILPNLDSFDVSGLEMPREKLEELFSLDKQFWIEEANEVREYFDEYVSDSTPSEIIQNIDKLTERVNAM